MKKVERSLLDPFVKWFFPKLLPFVPERLTANKISYIGLLISFLSGLSMALGFLSPWMFVLGAFFLFLTWITDTMDGVVARARKQSSKLGHYLDHFGDSLGVLFIGVGMYLTNGSHLIIGIIASILYLLFHVEGHIKVQVIDTLELPVIGPTEIRFLIISVILGQVFFDYGRPLSWFPEITGADGWLTRFFGFSTGMTFVDFIGVIAIVFGFFGLIFEVINTTRRLYILDKKGKK